MNKAQEDGYIECTECGHPIEHHRPGGCSTCNCTVGWSPAEIVAYRTEHGLPKVWENWRF